MVAHSLVPTPSFPVCLDSQYPWPSYSYIATTPLLASLKILYFRPNRRLKVIVTMAWTAHAHSRLAVKVSTMLWLLLCALVVHLVVHPFLPYQSLDCLTASLKSLKTVHAGCHWALQTTSSTSVPCTT